MQPTATETLVSWVSDNAARVPQRPALFFGDQERTYAELEQRTARAAAALAQRGVGAGDHVALAMTNRLEFAETLIGLHRLGAVAVPLNFRLAQPEIDYILTHSGAVGVVSDGALADAMARARGAVPTLAFHLSAGPPHEDAVDFEAALAAVALGSEPGRARQPDVAVIMYTSGTTGRPKGAMLTHRNLVCQAVNMTLDLDVREGDVWLSGAPLFHIAGVAGLLPYLRIGTAAVITPSGEFDPGAAIALLRRRAVTACYFVPTQWDAICRRPEASMLAPPLRTAIWGASPATRPTLERMEAALPSADIVSSFGQTEMSPCTTWLKGPDSLRKMGTVGKPASNVEVRVVDESGADVPPGEIGEIVYRGETTMRGYHGDAAATAAAFAGGWFHSGDLVTVDEDGFITVVGRKKDLIISGGENVYPAEVEEALITHPAVADVTVVGVPHERWVETPVAVVVLEPDAEASETELIYHCRGRIASYKKPTRVFFVASLPRNAAGKVLKHAAREQVLQEAGSR